MRIVTALVAIAIGVLILLGTFFNIPILVTVRTLLLEWAILLAAFALLVGAWNLISVHWGKVRSMQPGGFYSAIVLISFVITLIAAILSGGPTGPWSQWIFNNVQVPIETSLVAVLAVVLIFSIVRLFRRRIDTFSVVFLVTVLLVLLGSTPLLFAGESTGLSVIRDFIVQVLATAGGRGLLLGIAMGTLAVGVRILIGSDRPYQG
jgi:hypothetical protein